MDEKWFYVQGSEKIGPVSKKEIEDLHGKGKLLNDTYVWTNGMENWVFLEEVEEFSNLFSTTPPPAPGAPPIPDLPEKKEMDWENLDREKRVFSIKSQTPGGEEKVYGLFSLEQLIQLANERRVNEKTLIYANGMEGFDDLGNLPIFSQIFPEKEVKPVERREGLRKPIIARIFFHDDSEVFDGIVPNISEGGLKIFMNGFPGKLGDVVSMNVHPEDAKFSFVAKGEVVDVMEGNIGFSVKFVELEEAAKDTIHNYLKK